MVSMEKEFEALGVDPGSSGGGALPSTEKLAAEAFA